MNISHIFKLGITKLIVLSSLLFRPDPYLYESVDEEPIDVMEQNVANTEQIELQDNVCYTTSPRNVVDNQSE